MENKDIKEPIELFGYECGKGWLPLIKEAEQLIADWNEKHPEGSDREHCKGEALRFVQVKEKFGTLTIYCNFYPEGFHEKLWELEDRSSKICEMCGETDGTTCKASHGWIYTLCPECRRKEEERWNKLFKKD